MPDTRLARAREGYEEYVYQPPKEKAHKHGTCAYDVQMNQCLCSCGAWLQVRDGAVWRVGNRFIDTP